MMSHPGAPAGTRPPETGAPTGCGARRRARASARTRRRSIVTTRTRRTGPRTGSRGGRDRDLAVDDLLLVLVELVLDVVDEATARGQGDALGRQVVHDILAAGDVTVDVRADEGLDRVVHALEHRGHDHGLQRRVVDGLVLVGVDADRPAAGRRRRPEDARTRTARRVVDDVGTRVEHARGQDLGTRGVVEPAEVTGRGDVLAVDLDVGLDRLGAGFVTRLELLDERGLHAADEADLAGLALQRSGDAGEEGTLLLREEEAGDVVALAAAVGQGHRAVDLREGGVGEVLGDIGEHLVVGEAHGDDRVVTLLRELREQLGTVGTVLVRRDLAEVTAVLLDGRLDTGEGRVVEGLVAAPDGVVGEADLEVARTFAAGAPAAATVLIACTGREGQAAGQQQRRGLRHPRSAQDDLLSGGTCPCCRGASRWASSILRRLARTGRNTGTQDVPRTLTAPPATSPRRGTH